MARSSSIVLSLALASLAASTANAQRYDFIDPGYLPGMSISHGEAINEAGAIVGYAEDDLAHDHAFLFADGVLIELSSLGGVEGTRAYGINDFGQASGWSHDLDENQRAVYWDGGFAFDFEPMPGVESSGRRINDGGHVVGVTQGFEGLFHAFLFDGVEMIDLGVLGDRFSMSWARDINSIDQIVGGSQIRLAGPGHAFLWENGLLSDLGTLGGSISQANGINELGQIVGFSTLDDEQQRGFVYADGVMTELGTFGGTESSARDLNDQGQVVGYAYTPDDRERHGAILDTDGVWYDLTYFAEFPQGWWPYTAKGINSSGQIVGTLINRDGDFRAYALSPKADPFTIDVDQLVRGQQSTFTVTGAQPNEMVYLAYSVRGTGWTFSHPLRVAVMLKNPDKAGSPVMADGDGNATFVVNIPNFGGQRSVWLQAVQRGMATQVLSGEIQ